MSDPAPAVDPAVLPGPFTGPAAWTGREMAATEEWIWRLRPQEVAELEAAAESVVASARPLAGVEAAHFPLPTLAPRLDALRRELLSGRGFALLRGLPVERYSMAEAATVYWGLGAHLGRAVSQNARGHLLGHVIDLGRSEHDPTARIYQTRARQHYHADSCDIVGLLCLRRARRGGDSTIVSSVTLFNEMRARHPGLVAELMRPIHVDRRGEVPPGAQPWYAVPVFSFHAGHLTTYYVRRYMTSSRRLPGVPPLAPALEAAFDALDALAEDPDLHLSMAFEPGDVQFLHNHQILHDRTGYEDWPEPRRRRHLLRLWLCPPDGRPLPASFAQRWGSIEPGRRGGIVVEGAHPTVPLAPE